MPLNLLRALEIFDLPPAISPELNKCPGSNPVFDAPTSTHGVFTSFSLYRCCCLHFCRNKFRCWRRDILRVKGQALFTNCNLFMTLDDMQSSSCNYSMRHQVPIVSSLLLVYLSSVANISVEISLGSCWRGDILRVKGKN